MYDALETSSSLRTGKHRTAARRTLAVAGSLPVGPPSSGAPVFAIEKGPASGGLFPGMVTVGRAPNNDLIIPGKDVSNFQAYFSGSGERWTLHDGNSSNGTFLRGVQLTAPALLDPDTPLALAAIRCRFLLPRPAYAVLTGRGPWRDLGGPALPSL